MEMNWFFVPPDTGKAWDIRFCGEGGRGWEDGRCRDSSGVEW